MTKDSGGPAVSEDGAPGPTREERDRGSAGTAGDRARKGEKPSASGRDRGGTSSGDDGAPIDLDTAHDRAS